MNTTVKVLLNEALIIKSYENDLNELLMLFENEGPITFEWDIAQERLDKAKENINTPKRAELFLKALINKVKNLPKKIRQKIEGLPPSRFDEFIRFPPAPRQHGF